MGVGGVSGSPGKVHHDHDDHNHAEVQDAGSISVMGDGPATAADRVRIAAAMDLYSGAMPIGEAIDAQQPNGLDQPSGRFQSVPMPKAATQSLTHGELDQQLATAGREAQAGDLSGAVARLSAIMNNENLPPTQRARAAAKLAEIAFTADPDTTRAELALAKAKSLDPKLDVRRLDVELLVSAGRAKEALAIVNDLLKEPAFSNQAGLWQMKANLLLATSDRPGALKAMENALLLAPAAGISPRELYGMKLDYARLLFENQRPDEAVKQCQEVLAAKDAGAAQLFRAHYTISELLPAPDFGKKTNETAADRKGPHAAEINKLFDHGNALYKSGDYAAMRKCAEEILKLEPNDGLAHRMWAIAFSEEQRVADGKKLIGPLDTPDKREALRKQLAALCAQGKPGATPKDLFPEWDTLNEVQQASVAYSVLGYGSLVPLAVKAGMKYHFAGPGTSAAFLSDSTPPDQTNIFGRHSYVIRGWFDPDTKFVVTGTERINIAAYGGRSTVSHEFAHLIHELFRQAHETPKAKRTPEQQKLAEAWTDIEKNFKEAKNKRNGQRFMDAYSSNNEWEYFAQAAEAVTNPNGEDSRRLFSANPKMWHMARDLVTGTRVFPPGSDPQIDHAAVGSEAKGSALDVNRLASTSKKPAVRAAAAGTLAQLNGLLLPSVPPPPPGAPAAPLMPSLWRGDAIQFGDARKLREAALAGDFEGALTQARALDHKLAKLSPDELRDVTSAYCDVLTAAREKAEWSALEIFISIITLGLGALFIHFLSKKEAIEARDFIEGHRPERLWRGAGQAMAAAGGPSLRDAHARLGDAGLRAQIERDLQARNPSWDAADVSRVTGWVLDGVKEEERAHPSVPGHPELLGLDAPGRDERKALLLARGGDLAAIEAGARPINFISKPEMINAMGIDELQAQATAELARLQQLEAQKGLSATKKKEIAEAKTQLLAFQHDLATGKHAYADGSRGLDAWQGDIAGWHTRMTALHQQVEALA